MGASGGLESKQTNRLEEYWKDCVMVMWESACVVIFPEGFFAYFFYLAEKK